MSIQRKEAKTKISPIDIHISKRLRLRRSILGVSQKKLAESLDVSFQQIQKYELGMNRISAGKLYQLSQALGVSVSYFYQGFDNSDVTKLENYDKDTLEIIQNYQLIKDKKIRTSIVAFIKSFSERI